jgi:hypothetical protein
MNGRFLTGNPRIEFDVDVNLAFNLAEILFDWNGRVWVAPQGQVTDGASIPRIVWPLLGHPFDKDVVRGALLHDQYYAKWAGSGDDDARRLEVDRMLHAALLADGMARWKVALVYRGVRLGGWVAWRGHAKRNRR